MSRVIKSLSFCSWCFAFVIIAAAAPAPKGGAWVGTWSGAPQLTEPRNLPPVPLADSTLRQIVHVSIGGHRVRVEFSNAFGDGPVTITAAAIATPEAPGVIHTRTSKALSFGGQPGVTIAQGAMAISDPVDYDLAPLANLMVTVQFGQISATHVTGHPGARCTSFLSKGDWVKAHTLPDPATFEHWYILSGVQVWDTHPAGVLAILGDSITDGHASTDNENRRWPDDLALRMHADPRTDGIGILNQGIGGNRLLHYGLGPAALARLDRDVLDQPDVRWLIVFEGVNDIGTSPKEHQDDLARKIIDAYREIIRKAHAHHILVYGATITPFGGSFYDSPAHEAVWKEVNHWIRNSGQFDDVIDFDAVMRDPAHQNHLAPAMDCGDHLHPSNWGYQVMAGAVDLGLFTR